MHPFRGIITKGEVVNKKNVQRKAMFYRSSVSEPESPRKMRDSKVIRLCDEI